jgi:hypothetical protein
MASTFSPNLSIELIGTGDQAGTWGTTTNSNLGTLIEQAISGYVTQAVATGTDTTITIPNGSTGVARNMYIELTGTGGASTNLIVPANKKLYFIFNNSTGAVTVKVSGQTGVSVPTGKKMVLVSNGTDIVNGLNYIADFGTNSFSVTNLTASSATITNLIATSGSITNLVSSDASATVLRAGSATLTHLSATSASITNLALTSLTISSLSITNVSVASATVSSNLTLSGNSANGVAYLNGSKVVIAGTALTFDGTQTLQLFATGNSILNLEGSGTNNGVMRFRNGTTGALSGLVGNNSKDLVFEANGSTERMRLDAAGNLGLNTTPPAHGSSERSLDVGTTVGFGRQSDGALVANFNAFLNASAQYIYRVSSFASRYEQLAGQHKFYTAPSGTAGNTISFTQAMTLDASGNLGIGTTSPIGKLQVKTQTNGNAAFVNSTSVSGGVKINCFNDAGSSSSPFELDGSTLQFNIAAVEKMRLDSSGNLGIGTSSPNRKLEVNGISRFTDGTSNVEITNGGGVGYIGPQTNHPLAFQTNNTERARITSGGNFGIANTAPDYNLSVGTPGSTAASYIQLGSTTTGTGSLFFGDTTGTGSGSFRGYVQYDHNIDALIFGSAATNRATITSGGQFQVASALAGSNLLDFNNSSATGYGISVSVNNDSSGTYRYFEGFSSSAAAQKIAIYTNGDVKNTNGVFAAFSDAKLKKDIVDAGSQWDDIKSLRVRKYRLKDDASKALQIGLIAQEVERVSPGLVNESQDETRDEDGNIVLTGEVTKGVKYSILYMKAVKALQEAMARIEQLEAKFAALESK